MLHVSPVLTPNDTMPYFSLETKVRMKIGTGYEARSDQEWSPAYCVQIETGRPIDTLNYTTLSLYKGVSLGEEVTGVSTYM